MASSGRDASKRKLKRLTPELRHIPNEHLILDMSSTFGMTRPEMLEILLRFPANVDCLVSDAERKSLCSWLGIKEPTDSQRRDFIVSQITRSSTGGQAWKDLLDGSGGLVDRAAYHRLRLKRLSEQVGRGIGQEELRRARASEQPRAVGAQKVSAIPDIMIDRYHTGIDGFDDLFGRDNDNVGVPQGVTILYGGAPGVGKTRTMLSMSALMASPMLGMTCIYNQAEFDLETFKSQYCKGVIKGDEDGLWLSDHRTLSPIIDMMYELQPQLLVIDSKDKVAGLDTMAGWKRNIDRLRRIGREIGCTIVLITHLNAKGGIYGGRKTEHDVDIVMLADHIEGAPGMFQCVLDKNRFGFVDKERAAIFRHLGKRVICVKRPYSVGELDVDEFVKQMGKTLIAQMTEEDEDGNIIEPSSEQIDAVMKDPKEEVDRILAKISEYGIDSLNADEREVLRMARDELFTEDERSKKSKDKKK